MVNNHILMTCFTVAAYVLGQMIRQSVSAHCRMLSLNLIHKFIQWGGGVGCNQKTFSKFPESTSVDSWRIEIFHQVFSDMVLFPFLFKRRLILYHTCTCTLYIYQNFMVPDLCHFVFSLFRGEITKIFVFSSSSFRRETTK